MFNGFERHDQFQTAALRYQVNFMAYALAVVREHHAPAAKACFADAQERLLHKIGDKRLWSYWRLENAWGNLRLGADPIPHQNIMYSGFTALQMALGGSDELHLHAANTPWACNAVGRSYNPAIKAAKDVAAGAVLITAISAALIGMSVFAPRVVQADRTGPSDIPLCGSFKW